jgi:hypothetical protein
MIQILTRTGLEVAKARNCEEAYYVLRQTRYHLDSLIVKGLGVERTPTGYQTKRILVTEYHKTVNGINDRAIFVFDTLTPPDEGSDPVTDHYEWCEQNGYMPVGAWINGEAVV